MFGRCALLPGGWGRTCDRHRAGTGEDGIRGVGRAGKRVGFLRLRRWLLPRYAGPMDVDAGGRPTTCRLSTVAERNAASRIGVRHGFTGEAFLRHVADDPDVAARMVGLPSGVRLYSAIHDEMGSRG